MNRLNETTRIQIVHSLCEGMSQRSCERIFAVSNKTIAKLFEDVGDMAIAYVSQLRDLTIRNIQADELHSFVGVKQAHLSEAISPVTAAGTVWAFLGSGLVDHSQKVTVAARAMAAKKVVGQRS